MGSSTNRLLDAAICGMAAALAASAARAEEPAGPAEVVAALHTAIVEVAAGGTSSDVTDRYAALRPVVARTHDLAYIAELSIRRYWDGLTDAERERFVAAFERLSVMTYATRFTAVTPETFAVLGSGDAGRGRVQVRAAIARTEQDDVALDYVLEQSGEGWRIVNILADGVSDLALKRAEYHRVLGAGSIEDLIAELDAQADRLQ